MTEIQADVKLVKSVKLLVQWLTHHFGQPRRVDHEVRSSSQHSETPSLLKIQKISQTWWQVPLIPATQEAEAGESLEPRRQRLRWVFPGTEKPYSLSETPQLIVSKESQKAWRHPGTVAHACNLNILGGQGWWITRGEEFETSLTNVLLWELRQENRLNLGSGGCNEPRLGHCTPAWHFGRPRQVDHLRSGVRDQPGQRDEMLTLQKI
ncbi:hypothetical protein AAY473_011233 [Plecturocebus cupreus]